jgi:hypothetical protein
MVSGPKIGVHAKGQAAGDAHEALLLLRWHNVMGTLRIANDDKSFSIVNPRAHFDAYRPGETTLPRASDAPVAAVADSGPSVGTESTHAAPTATPHKARKKRSDDRVGSDPFLDHSL